MNSYPAQAPPSEAAPESWQAVEQRVVGYWRLSGVLGAALLFVVPAFYGVPALIFSPRFGVALLVVGAGLCLLRLVWIFATTALRYRRLRYSVAGAKLWVRDGVLVRREKLIPAIRMQHVDIERGPLERWFDLASISVFTAGGRRATFRLEGLSPERAEELRAQLLRDARID